MVLIKNWKTKTNEELQELWPTNYDSKKYVILTDDGVWYYTDLPHLEPR